MSNTQVVAVGPRSGGVSDAFGSAMEALERLGVSTQTHRLGNETLPALEALRLLWRLLHDVWRTPVLHVEFGSNDKAAFWFALMAAHVRPDSVTVVHDLPKVAHAPAAGLVPVQFRIGALIGFRVLSPLLDGWLVNRLIKRAGRIVVLSAAAAEVMATRGASSVAVVPLGGPAATRNAPPPSRGDHVLLAGYLGPSKGVDVLIASWRRIGPRSTLPLVIAGPPATSGYDEYLTDVERSWKGIPNPPRWLGPVPRENEFHDLFAQAAVVVLPYRYSSPASSVLVRAMVEGRCIVATPVPAALDALHHERDALIVPIDDVGALTDALDRVMGDPALRDRLGACAARAGKRFSSENTARALLAAYPPLGKSVPAPT